METYHTNQEIEDIYLRHIDMIFRICYSYMKNISDSEDAVSSTFLKYLKTDIHFDSLKHEKSWFIVTASNTCKDMLKHWWRKNSLFDEQISTPLETFEIDKTLEVILALPHKYKTVIYLYYYEEYNSHEIADLLAIPPSTVRNQLSRAKKILKRKLGDFYEQ